ncbi:MAG TPA: hypothetical protein VK619_16435 [Pyrinomonadaceae bacterium]|nr:hypothetical protein [Pyrinomonadaceae bacterium]
MRIKFRKFFPLALALLFCFAPFTLARAASDESDVRAVVRDVFQSLKSGDYDALYDRLPSASQQRVARERFVSSLQRTRGTYELDRIEIGAIRISGDLAVVDTVMYGRVLQPEASEGKIVAQQYLVRENGTWRVATGERSTVQRLLNENPNFARKFPIRQPRIFVKRDGRWVDITALANQMRRNMRQ